MFGGAVGYLGWHGEMDMSIAIPTCVIRDQKVYVQAGGRTGGGLKSWVWVEWNPDKSSRSDQSGWIIIKWIDFMSF